MEKEIKTTEQLVNDYSWLKPWNQDRKQAGKNIKADLQKNFPSVKFSVRYDSFAGGDSYNIEWTDGPTVKEVEEVAGKFEDIATYDPYSDYYDYKITDFQRVFGGAKYVECRREISQEARIKAEEELKNLNDGLSEETFSTFNHINGLGFRENMNYIRTFSDAVSYYARSKSWMPEAEEKEVTESNSELQIVDYSEKSFAVIGETRKYKKELKDMGGKFNAKLSCGAGWIFPKSRIEKVRSFIR